MEEILNTMQVMYDVAIKAKSKLIDGFQIILEIVVGTTRLYQGCDTSGPGLPMS